ncbi:hypothetical protein EJ02DRAFT_468052 [Clathrospora elynae]|uniref:mRNA export factor GLE1 n=1 Tax=Clathrospora elynae TaxID=706981 RepID=A0A6A5SI41_9PLEO|nr:hypothetical protein EJ02DRAFT_468052 [Clathrospora elynae]
MPARSGTSSVSMHTATSFGSSFTGGSPSRQSPNRTSLRPQRESLACDPYESPSRQLSLEFNLRLSISDRDFNEKLDQAAAERAKQHAQQLAQAAEEHKRVLRSAELELERIALEKEQVRLRYEEAQKKEVERLKREKAQEEAEAHRRALEARQREEAAARQAAEHQKKLQEAEARIQAQKNQVAAAEKQQKEKAEAEADRKAAEAAAAAAKARPQPAPQQTAARLTPAAALKQPTGTLASAATVDQIHAKYIELHARMKHFRKSFWDEHRKPTSPLKGPVGDARRALRTRLGQISVARATSITAIQALRRECFDMAKNTRGPIIDIRPYMISHQVPPLADDAEAQYPAFLLYVWICFEKFLVEQFVKEAANPDGRIIQEIGLIAASLLGDQNYMWKGIPVSDILVAKLHKICPPLFGIRGVHNLGKRETLTEDTYGQRMRGIGAGYAAMSLRTFSSKVPAIPMSEYWRAIASICNTPPEHLHNAHFNVLYGLLRDSYKKFLMYYGVPARGVLRRATIDLPAHAPERCKAAAGSVAVLPEGWKKEQIVVE